MKSTRVNSSNKNEWKQIRGVRVKRGKEENVGRLLTTQQTIIRRKEGTNSLPQSIAAKVPHGYRVSSYENALTTEAEFTSTGSTSKNMRGTHMDGKSFPVETSGVSCMRNS